MFAAKSTEHVDGAMDDDIVDPASRPSTPLPLSQRTFKPLPKRARLSTGQSHVWSGVEGSDSGEAHLNPSLDASTASTTDNDQPTTPPTSHLYFPIFSNVGHLVKEAAANSTLFAGAVAELSKTCDPDGDGDDGGGDHSVDHDYDGEDGFSMYDHGLPSGQFARLAAAAAGLLLTDGDGRGGRDVHEGGNKKKRKVPSAAGGHPFSYSPPPSQSASLSNSARAAPGSSAEDATDRDTGMRADFATAMVGVVKALGPPLPPSFGLVHSKRSRVPWSVGAIRTKLLNARRSANNYTTSTIQAADGSETRPTHKPEKLAKPKAPAPPPMMPGKELNSTIRLPNFLDPIGATMSRSLAQPDPHTGLLTPPSSDDGVEKAQPPVVPVGPSYNAPTSSFTFRFPSGSVITTRLNDLEKEKTKLKRAKEIIIERAKELGAARSRGDDGSQRKAGRSSKAIEAKPKSYSTSATQTGEPDVGRIMFYRPRPNAIDDDLMHSARGTASVDPVTGRKVNPTRKGKKKRAAHANANNVHHRDNYVPSRVPARPQPTTKTAQAPSLGLVDPASPFSVAAAPPAVAHHPQLGLSPLVPFFAGPEEWLCSFCEMRILYGSPAALSEAVRKRKGVLKVRKRAQERAAKAASGQAGKSVKAKDSRPKPVAQRVNGSTQTTDPTLPS